VASAAELNLRATKEFFGSLISDAMWGPLSEGCPEEQGLLISTPYRGTAMKRNQQKVEEAVLAVLWLTLHSEAEAWKTIDWDTMDRLHQRGFISNPARRAKSVVFTDEGLAEAERAAKKIFV
jgi:hypothetical protein